MKFPSVFLFWSCAVIMVSGFRTCAAEWTLPEGLFAGGFEMEWIRIGRESSVAPWVLQDRTTPPTKQVDVFFPDCVVTNGIGADLGKYTVPSVIYNEERHLLQLHPGYNDSNPDEVLASIAWTAPEAGSYTAVGDFAIGNVVLANGSACCPNGTDYWIYRDDLVNQRLWEAAAPNISADSTKPFLPDASRPFALTVTLQQGAVLHFAVRPRAGENYDATLLRLKITRAEGLPPVAAADLRDVQVPLTSGSRASLEFPASGVGTGFLWYRDGAYYTNTTTPRLSLLTIRQPTTNLFQAIATNAFGSVTSRVALITFWPRPWILTQPPARIVTTNATAEISLSCIPTESTFPVLYRNGQFVQRDHQTHSEAHFIVRDSGTYRISIGSGGGSTNAETQVFFVKPEPDVPRLQASASTAGGAALEVTVQVEAGRNYRLESSADLVHWTPALEWFADLEQTKVPIGEPNDSAFYRTILVSTPFTD